MNPSPPAPPHPPPMTHADVLQRLAQSGLLEDSQVLWFPSADGSLGDSLGEGTLSGRVMVGGHEVRLRVRLPAKFPLCLPDIQVEGIQPHVELPHMLGGRSICFPEDANLLDSDDPYAIAWEALVYARELLGDMIAGNRAREFAQEAFAYWHALAQGRLIDCVVSAGDHPYPLVAFLAQGRLCAVADDSDVYARSLPERSIEGLIQRNALYLPLGPAVVEQEFRLRELATLEGIRKHVRALPEEDRRRLSLLLGRQGGHDVLLVLGLRRPQGERALLGVMLAEIQGGHPLDDGKAQARVEPIELLRRDLSFLAPRGGAGTDLQERRVLVAGCGSVGGYIALSLARTGLGTLSLVDPDVFSLENTYRHACGMSWSGHPKVEGLREEIERTIPYVDVQPFQARIEDLPPSILREHDLVISALGHPTIELHLNKRIWSDEKHPPALFTWLEPLGLGGHALLTHVRGAQESTRGCLKCLYQRSVEGGAIENRAAFAMPGAIYTRDMLGCGSRYLPFADLDAQRTAELASRLALRVLRGEVTNSLMLSWKGDSQAFEQAGYSVTPRYALEPVAQESHSTYTRADCPVCGAR